MNQINTYLCETDCYRLFSMVCIQCSPDCAVLVTNFVFYVVLGFFAFSSIGAGAKTI